MHGHAGDGASAMPQIAGGIFTMAGGVITVDAESAVVDNAPAQSVGTGACPPA